MVAAPLKETQVKKNTEPKTTAGTGGGGDENFIYAPKRATKKKDLKQRMAMIN